MGLRSRQRRRAGVADPFDIETSRQHSAHSLEDHLRASIRDVDAFNLVWKKTIALGGLVMLAYEVYLLYLLLVGCAVTTNPPASRLPIYFILKMVAFASIASTREYITRGSAKSFGSSMFFTGSYFVIWFSCLLLLEEKFTTAQVSPLCIVYFVVSALVLRLIGDNTKAEVARAEQLEKLEKLFGASRY
ncbi:hypothetical protein Gpo141_00008113 [Globisporangium polare]